MSTIAAAGGGTSTYVSLALHTRVRTSLGLANPTATSVAGAADPTDSTSAASAQAFSAFAQAILAVLAPSGASQSTTTPSSTTATDTTGASGTSGTTGTSTDSTGSSPAAQVANALAAALGPSGTGSGGVSALLDQIRTAIDNASASLVQSGASSDQVQGFASQFKTQLSQALDSLAASLSSTPSTGSTTPVTTGGTTAVDPTQGTATVHIVEKGTIRLQTQEGDIVTIRLRNSATFGYGGTGATGAAAYAQQSSYGSSRFSVSVQGNLNSDELSAIDNVLSQVDTLATEFFSGQFSDAFATAAALQTDPNEIARVSIRLSESESLSVTAPAAPPASSTPTTTPSTTDTTGTSAAGGPSTPPTTTTTTPATTGTTPATTDTTGSTATGDTTGTAGTTGTTGTTDGSATTPASTDGTSGPTSLLDAIFAYLKDVLAELGTTTQAGNVTITAKAKLDLLAGAVVAASLTVKESTAAGFLKSITSATTDAGATSGTSSAA